MGSESDSVVKIASESALRERVSFNQFWRFLKFESEDLESSIPDEALLDYDDTLWRPLELPHDWGIEGPFEQDLPGETGKLPWAGTGWYRKHFRIPECDEGRRYVVEFDGAMSNADVWLNGHWIGEWPYGYSSFYLDLTPHLRFGGENVIAVRLRNLPESSRWYPGGGIYRNVWLTATSTVHVAQWGAFIFTPFVSRDRATVRVQLEISNTDIRSHVLDVKTEIENDIQSDEYKSLPIAEKSISGLSIDSQGLGSIELELEVESPVLWTPQSPHLYSAVITLSECGQECDRVCLNFGIRSVQITQDKGFMLNGERMPLQGVCCHHDLGALGAAVNRRAIERQIELLQELGCNALRTTHNPPAPELLDICDQKGMLVIVEAFDCWKLAKKPNDYSCHFEAWHEKDLRAMIRRDRNHPCVIMWSTGNEILEQEKIEYHVISKRLTEITHDEDPTRLVTVGCNIIDAGFNGFQNTVDVFGYNYKPGYYERFHRENPTIPLYGSETASCVSSRGEYYFPVLDDKAQGKANFHVSSYDLYAPAWATPPDVEFAGLDANPNVLGEFVWTGFDYLGEPTPYNADATNLLNVTDPEMRAEMQKQLDELGRVQVPSRSSYFGIFDLAGFKKDRFYLYQSRWRPDFPMAHILPHWNWPERVGQTTPVHVYTSGDEAELFLNGRSLGRKNRGKGDYRFRWDDVLYEPGELRVVTWKEGTPWATQTMETTGHPYRLSLCPDRVQLVDDGYDLAFVTVSVLDTKDRKVPRSNLRVQLAVEGPGEIVAVDNGDPTSHALFQCNTGKLFNGLCLVIVKRQRSKNGTIRLSAASDGLHEAIVELN